MLKTLLIDDEDDSRTTLRGFLTRYCPDVVITGEGSSVSEAVRFIAGHAPELVFLDINMPHENGFELFRYIPDPEFQTVFVTAYDEYALKAIKLHALDYILKPVSIDELVAAVRRAKLQHDRSQMSKNIQDLVNTIQRTQVPDKLSLPVADGFIYASIQDIIRCEAEGSYTVFYFMGRPKLMVSKTLGSYEEVLKAHGFIRVHHHHLINLRYVERYHRGRGGSILMSDKKEVEVSQRRRDEFLRLISKLDQSPD